MDFLPGFVLIALANFSIYIHKKQGLPRHLLVTTVVLLIAYSAVANLALGIEGPYDYMLKYHTRRYMRLSNRFSLVARHRPVLNPQIAISFNAQFVDQPDGGREPLVLIGNSDRHFIYVEHRAGVLRIASNSNDSTVSRDLQLPYNQPVHMDVSYSPETQN